MTIQIPTPPAFANISLPVAPTLDIHTISVSDITEPAITDPTGSLRAFSYERYASVLNNLLDGKIEELLTWSGDEELFWAQSSKDKDEIAKELLETTNSILSNSAAKGFMFLPGHVKEKMLSVDRDAKDKMVKSGLMVHGEIADTALKFIQWAADAGTRQVRIGVDENKSIVYANMDAVRDMAGAMLDTQQKHIESFDGKAKLYQAALASLETGMLQDEALLENFDAGVMAARQQIAKDDIELDKRHAENLGVAINNASVLVQAQGKLQEAELERQKVLQSQAVIAGFLAKIKEVHAGLVENRADVETVIADLDDYKSRAKLADIEARGVLTEIDGASNILSQYYQLSMAQVKKAKADIMAVESGVSEDKSYSAKVSESYRRSVREQLIGFENTDLTTLTDNRNRMTDWITSIEGNYTEDLAGMRVDHRVEKIGIDSTFAAKKEAVKGCAELRRANWQSQADTELKLLHTIM